MTHRRYLLSFIAVALTLSLAIHRQEAHAAVLDDSFRNLNDSTNEVLNAKISAEQRCEAQRLVAGIERSISAGKKLINLDIRAEIKNSAKIFASVLLQCKLAEALNDAVNAGRKYFGLPPKENPVKCVNAAIGQVQASAVALFDRSITGIFEDTCYQAELTRTSFSTIESIIQENGRDGGAAFVQDWRDLAEHSQYRGVQIAKNQMANTDYCPWNKDVLQAVFGFGNKSTTVVRDYADGQTSYIQSAGCSLPNGFDPTRQENQTLAAYAALSLPQNSLAGSYLLARENIERQKAAELAADEHEFQSGYGGLRPINPATGTACEVWNADNTTCLQYAPIVQPGEGVKSFVDAKNKTLFELYNKNGIDPTNQIITSMLDASKTSAEFNIDVAYSLRRLINKAAKAIDPEDPTTQPQTPETLACTGGNPLCECVTDAPKMESLRQLVAIATQEAIDAHPELVTANGGQVLPGANTDFLNAVCSTEALARLNCHVIQDDEIVLDFEEAGTVSLDLITGGENGIRIPGQSVALCQPGVQ